MSVNYLPPFLLADLRELLPNPAKGPCAEVINGVITYRKKMAVFYEWMFAFDGGGFVTGFSDAFKAKLCDEVPLCLHQVGEATTTPMGGGVDGSDGSSSTASTASTSTQTTAMPAPCFLFTPFVTISSERLYWTPVPNAERYEVFVQCGEGAMESLGYAGGGLSIAAYCRACNPAIFFVQAQRDGCTSSGLGQATCFPSTPFPF